MKRLHNDAVERGVFSLPIEPLGDDAPSMTAVALSSLGPRLPRSGHPGIGPLTGEHRLRITRAGKVVGAAEFDPYVVG